MTGVQLPIRSMMRLFPSPPRPDWLWAPSSFLSKGYRGSYPGGKRDRDMKLTKHFHLVPRSRIPRAILPLPQYVFMAWYLIKQWTSLHGVLLS